MSEDEKPHKGLFEDDELDEEIRSADDTGLVAQQQEVVAEETALPDDEE